MKKNLNYPKNEKEKKKKKPKKKSVPKEKKKMIKLKMFHVGSEGRGPPHVT